MVPLLLVDVGCFYLGRAYSLEGEQLYINHDGMLPDGKPERAA